MNKEQKHIIKNNKSVALLAPSFPIDFKYPAIIGMLRKLGFDEVTELTFGARMVNWWYVEYVKNNPNQKLFIASPCPTVTTFIKNNYPSLSQYLIPFASPMLAMAKIYKKHHPDSKVVFISPCFAKRTIEAPKHKDYIDLVLTYKELKELFDLEDIKEEDFNRNYFFDSVIREYTKIYPVSGGLASTSGIEKLFKKSEILVDDGIINIKNILDQADKKDFQYRFLDILNCPGGCVGGPAINNKNFTQKERQDIIMNYIKESSEHILGSHKGALDYADDVDLMVDG